MKFEPRRRNVSNGDYGLLTIGRCKNEISEKMYIEKKKKNVNTQNGFVLPSVVGSS